VQSQHKRKKPLALWTRGFPRGQAARTAITMSWTDDSQCIHCEGDGQVPTDFSTPL
jgi:hypothetical protein